MRGPFLAALAAVALTAHLSAIPIVVSPRAGEIELLAAHELADHLGRLYTEERFPIVHDTREMSVVILGIPAVNEVVSRYVSADQLSAPESFVIATREDGGRRVGIIAASSPRGLLHAIYALLERLGFGFYLAFDTAASARQSAFDFEGWDLRDAPLVPERLVFNWHNFLSSASTWDFEDWQHYIERAARMRFNGIMVHAYGNNPMFTFTHNGETKPAGYLSTTRSGRDWGTQHVNDVRSLYGARGIFTRPVFGSSAALVPDNLRVAAATTLMQRVFAYAESRGLGVTFAIDVDTIASNPQNVILTLPPEARVISGDVLLANPDSAAGYAYYKSQVSHLVTAYPQIDQVAVWFRRNRTPWRDVRPGAFPVPWRDEYRDALARTPGLAGDEWSASMFAIGKIVRAYRKALDELGRSDVELATGTWGFDHFRAADAFFPPYAKLMALDYQVRFESEEIQDAIRAVSGRRTVVPIVWAHHDDFTYIGRPYTPFARFASTLEANGSRGYAIIHWTTRPLDLYFKSLSRQVWSASGDESLDVSCRRMAQDSFGPRAARAGATYLLRWIHEAPMFGRETTDRFIDRPLMESDKVIERSESRWDLLHEIDKGTLSAAEYDRWAYYVGFERFIQWFFRSHAEFELSVAALEKAMGESGSLRESYLEKARREIQSSRPEQAIEHYAAAARHGGITKGEQALIISLNLRWLPYFVTQRQVLGLEPVRVNFQPTQHDPLAQGAGHNTSFFDGAGKIWQCLGERETGLPVAVQAYSGPTPEDLDPGLLFSGLHVEKPMKLRLAALTGAKLIPGDYTVELVFMDGQQVTRNTRRVRSEGGAVEVEVAGSATTRLCAAVIQPAR